MYIAGMQKNLTYLEDSYAAVCISEITMESTVFLLSIQRNFIENTYGVDLWLQCQHTVSIEDDLLLYMKQGRGAKRRVYP